MDKVVFVSVGPHDSIFLSTMNALEDLEEYESLRLKIAIRSELFEDLTLHYSIETTTSREQVMVGFTLMPQKKKKKKKKKYSIWPLYKTHTKYLSPLMGHQT